MPKTIKIWYNFLVATFKACFILLRLPHVIISLELRPHAYEEGYSKYLLVERIEVLDRVNVDLTDTQPPNITSFTAAQMIRVPVKHCALNLVF